MQYFKGNQTEKKFYDAGRDIFDLTDLQLNTLLDELYLAYPLGEALWDSKAAPLTNAILRSIFRESFREIFEAFISGGTFDSYTLVFRKIFGEDVVVNFNAGNLTASMEPLDPGILEIDVVASGFEISKLVARSIENNAYVFDYIVDHLGNNIVVQTIKGFATQYELEQMLFEMVPNGIATTITLTIGGDEE